MSHLTLQHKGNIKYFLLLKAKHDTRLAQRLENSSVFVGTLNLIQNDVISSVINVNFQNIKQ